MKDKRMENMKEKRTINYTERAFIMDEQSQMKNDRNLSNDMKLPFSYRRSTSRSIWENSLGYEILRTPMCGLFTLLCVYYYHK